MPTGRSPDDSQPILPLYVEELGVSDHAAILQMVRHGLRRDLLHRSAGGYVGGHIGEVGVPGDLRLMACSAIGNVVVARGVKRGLAAV
ncbi:hypothetical protein [Bradyrhizobium sp. STM 3557]|uniref:hypothetical protein n=1 Tax=Bradyrhizobium sp. STM 3557 TaxID=578920 RepID=UPI00388D26C2